MTTLADLILASPQHRRLLAVPGGPDGRPPAAVPVVVADAASEFLFAGTLQEDWEFGRDFPNCTPPSSPIFVEMARPSRVVSGVHGLTSAANLPARWGWRFEATSRPRLSEILADDRRAAVLVGYYRRYADHLASSVLVDVPGVEPALDGPDRVGAAGRLNGPDGGYFAAARIVRALGGLKAGAAGDDGPGGLGWLLHGALVLERDGLAVGPVGTLDVMLEHGGRPSPAPLIDIFGGDQMSGAEAAVLRKTILPLVFPALLALSFMNTEGVTLRTVEPPPEVNRRRVEQGLPAPVGYLVMDIGAVAGVDRN